MLNISADTCNRYEEIKAKYPEEYSARREDKLAFRYPGPGGESYMDVIHRMKELIVEVERMVDHVILVGHRVVARVLLAYFMGLNRNDVAHVDIPLGRLYVLEPVSASSFDMLFSKLEEATFSLTFFSYSDHMA